mgnify:FL=1
MHLQCTCNANAMHLHKTPIDYQRVTTIKFLSSQKTMYSCVFSRCVNMEQAKNNCTSI